MSPSPRSTTSRAPRYRKTRKARSEPMPVTAVTRTVLRATDSRISIGIASIYTHKNQKSFSLRQKLSPYLIARKPQMRAHIKLNNIQDTYPDKWPIRCVNPRKVVTPLSENKATKKMPHRCTRRKGTRSKSELSFPWRLDYVPRELRHRFIRLTFRCCRCHAILLTTKPKPRSPVFAPPDSPAITAAPGT